MQYVVVFIVHRWNANMRTFGHFTSKANHQMECNWPFYSLYSAMLHSSSMSSKHGSKDWTLSDCCSLLDSGSIVA
jgi:hypothetical protein